MLYGRRDGFHLSALGHQMAQRIAETIGERDIVHIRTSPLERAQETGAPLAQVRGLTPVVDPRVIESTNAFEGLSFGDGAMTNPTREPVAVVDRRPRRHDGRSPGSTTTPAFATRSRMSSRTEFWKYFAIEVANELGGSCP